MFLTRTLNLPELLAKKSFFLFGPRATGKSSLIREQFSVQTPVIDLLRSEVYFQLSTKPHLLEPIIDSFENPQLVAIDEVQRVPALLNEVHRLIEQRKIRFLLTGSSARSLRKNHVNLLAGRAWEAQLFPLTWHEIPDFDLMRYLQFGGLPAVYLSEYPQEELHAYTLTYLKEEIQAEALVRRIPAFTRFLQMAALCSGQLLNYTKIASDTSNPVSTIREYYHILEDTFLGFILPPWTQSQKRKAASTAKFYLFDLGIKHTLAGVKHLESKSDMFGQAFEHFIIAECRAYLSYTRQHLPLTFWHTKHGHEVDLLIDTQVAIEIKATEHVTTKHLKGLQLLAQEQVFKRYILVSNDPVAKKIEAFEIMPWQMFFQKLWQGEIIHA